MDELTAWVRACLADEERMARKALGEVSLAATPANAREALAAAWTPERILTDLALKQRVLDLHVEARGSCATCRDEAAPCLTVRLLALPYADRPGYRADWRPDRSHAPGARLDPPARVSRRLAS